MNILVINCGSSSCKYQLINMEAREQPLCSGVVERIGEAMGSITHKVAPGTGNERRHAEERHFADHASGLELVLRLLLDSEQGVISRLEDIDAVGHRVVQGGETFPHSCLVGDAEMQGIEELAPLAPLHNPANLQGIAEIRKLLPHAPNVAVFDTEFHATMPRKAFLYPLPYEFYEKLRIRRYGAHGTSHRYVARAAAAFLGKTPESCNLITCHLGNGGSITAVREGRSVDTSMGMTPLAGIMMGTRCGDIDPAIHAYLGRHRGLGLEEIDALLNKQSGLKGICGMNDMRDIHAACEKGDERARMALEMLCYSIRKYIGAYFAVLGRVDALVFTAGIGENDDHVRAGACAGLEHMGIVVDAGKNAGRSRETRNISPEGTRVPVLVVPTNEELAIAEATLAVLRERTANA